jgi:hypothetical protein
MCTIGTGTTVERRRREREAGKLPFAKSNKTKPGKLDRLKQHKWLARRFGIAAGVSSASVSCVKCSYIPNADGKRSCSITSSYLSARRFAKFWIRDVLQFALHWASILQNATHDFPEHRTIP